ncbi:DUF4097 family beta strand repeat-containing protein [Streptomyces sp. NPDC087917]|uniref:DUF4097 family beta strand repeat-containing protein n=1 Tax=Streptomyces sp. NPDC087917 TaxID=3155060 RepID=UPI00342C1755
MQKFNTPAAVSAVLDIPAGHVRLAAADRAETTVEVLPADASKGRDVKAAEQITVDFVDGVLRVGTEPTHKLLGNSGSVKVTVHLATGSAVEAKLGAGEFHTTGRLGAITFEGAQGSIHLDETASARLTLLAGDVTLGRLNGPAEITTRKGDITIAEAVRGTVTLRTEAGNLTITTAPGVSASLDAGATIGRIHNSLKNPTGTADLSIHATTSYGDITARSL